MSTVETSGARLFGVPDALDSDAWYTPPWIFDGLGVTFDLDVASPAEPLEWLPARERYTVAEDGLNLPWHGLVWCSPTPRHHALHSCDNPPCCNPNHLRWGTNDDNVSDRDGRGRTLRGVELASSKLTPASVQELRSLSAEGWSTRRLARRFGVSDHTVRQAIHRRTWRHVPDLTPGATR